MYDNVIAAINSLKDLVEKQSVKIDHLTTITEELRLIRKGNEAFVYGQEVKDSDEVNLEEESGEKLNTEDDDA